ncbi:MAG: hypothetical protein D6714_08940, partial [Bacteroidetes bacterium]
RTLLNWVDEMKEKLAAMESVSEEKAAALKASLEELRLQAALAAADTEDALKNQQKNLARKLHRVKHAAVQLEHEVGEEAADFIRKMTVMLEGFQSRVEVFRWQLTKKSEVFNRLWADKKRKVAEQVKSLTAKLNEEKAELSETWNIVSGELIKAWKNIRKALKEDEEGISRLSALHFEHRQWKSEIDFWEDELNVFDEKLTELAAEKPDKEVMAKIEHFQNAFLIHRKEIDDLDDQIRVHETLLARYAAEHRNEDALNAFKAHDIIREAMDTERRLFKELKEEFYNFLKSLKK